MIEEIIVNGNVLKVQRVDGATVPLNDIQKVIEYYKTVKGYDKLPDWNDNYFNRHVKTAQKLLHVLKSLEAVCQCIDFVSEKGYNEWGLNTVFNKAPDFQIMKNREQSSDGNKYKFI